LKSELTPAQLNIYYHFFGVCGICYALTAYRKETVAMINQNIKKDYELEELGGVIGSVSNLYEKNRRRIV